MIITRKLMPWVAVIAAGLSLTACSDDADEKALNDDNTTNVPLSEMAHLEAGQILCRQFTYHDVTIDIEDEMVNFGEADAPILFPVNKTVKFSAPGYEGAVFVTTREHIEAFMRLWANATGLPFETEEEKIIVAENVYTYFIVNEIDFGLFVALVMHNYDVNTLKAIGRESRAANVDFNSVLYGLWSQRDQITPEQVRSRGAVKDVFSIIEGVIDLYNVWNDFTKNADPIAEATDGRICSFLSPANQSYENYCKVKDFDSGEFKLKYWVSGIWHAQFHYKIEGYTGCLTGENGRYVPAVRVTTTELSVKGPYFIGQGKYKFSDAINIGRTADAPVVQANGMVQVVYGDCCCFRFFSYLNFSVDGENGYRTLSYDDGK